MVILLGLFGCQGDSTVVTSPAAGPVFPRQLVIPGVGTHGIFDAAMTEGPSTGRIWMSYSAVNPSVAWPSQNPDVVSTRIASSSDFGATWTDAGAVNPVLDVELALAAPLNAGTWTNEVSSLIYDPGAAAPAERWKLLWHHYLNINEDRRFEHGWIGLKMAETPEGLRTASEVKLFSGAAYDTGNNLAGGPSKSPVGGPPAIALDTALSPQLNGCFFSEPGMLATAQAVYLSMNCAKSAADHRIVLLKCASPCTMTSAAAWTYLGTVLSDADGDAFGFDNGFTAPHLVASGGKTHLMVTGAKSVPFDSYYSGCKVFRFSNLETATLERVAGAPVLIASAAGDAGSFNGACTYLPSSTRAGIVYGQATLTSPKMFRLYSSGLSF